MWNGSRGRPCGPLLSTVKMQKDKQQAQLGIWGKQLLQQANNSRFNETRNMLGAASHAQDTPCFSGHTHWKPRQRCIRSSAWLFTSAC